MRGMIISHCPKMGNTINELAKANIIKPVFVSWMGTMHKANSLFAALDWLKSQGYYHPDQKEMAEFAYVQ